jgi:hypothetical protein
MSASASATTTTTTTKSSESEHLPSDAYHVLVQQLEALCVDADPCASLDMSLADLNDRDRRRIYERIDIYCVGKLARTRQDVFDGKTKVVHLHVTRVPVEDAAAAAAASTKPIKVDDQIVSHFQKYTRALFPIVTVEMLPYYLDMLVPFCDIRTKWERFLVDIQTYGSVTRVNGAVNKVRERNMC